MLRCVLLAAAALAFPAVAQVPRVFPQNALRGEIVVAQPPDVLLNGQQARLAPGARIHDEANLLQVSGRLANRRLVVNYTVDPQGQLHEVWILSAAERANRPWPRTTAEAAAWQYNGQSWSRP
jgi:hypothetical protein